MLLGSFHTLLEKQPRFSFLPQLVRGNFGKWKGKINCLKLFSERRKREQREPHGDNLFPLSSFPEILVWKRWVNNFQMKS